LNASKRKVSKKVPAARYVTLCQTTKAWQRFEAIKSTAAKKVCLDKKKKKKKTILKC
jgi:hypothetical protein